MMYETIYKALVEVGLEDAYTPQDYLNFYCLGNREALDAGEAPDSQPITNNPQVLYHCSPIKSASNKDSLDLDSVQGFCVTSFVFRGSAGKAADS